ncbi:unnamed protein product [Gemmata massiliana]|uniref:Uncharacterized protein n=1 Tax=Gemmata massiliana TaxID=1210884 RepID=A0A6P2D1T7_9BACT|nr:hypothetical protein [Gemmata massiliana]VTR95089.1 unnamed protein product [Gemmata massiliana]
MTPISNTTEVAPVAAALEVATAEKLLRDMAYVLKLTRRVKAEMAAEPVTEEAVIARTWERVLGA